jgi:hypothetical protein
MLNPQTINVICHTFACPQRDVKWAEDKGERLLAKYGVQKTFEYLEDILQKLSAKDRWEGYEKMALVKMVLSFSQEGTFVPASDS